MSKQLRQDVPRAYVPQRERGPREVSGNGYDRVFKGRVTVGAADSADDFGAYGPEGSKVPRTSPAHLEEPEAITLEELSEVSEVYLACCVGERRLNLKTVKAYRCDISQYLAWAEEGQVNYSRSTMREYLVHLNTKYSVSSVRRKLAALRAWSNWMCREGYIQVSPFKDLDISIRKPIILPRVIGPADLRLLMDPGDSRIPICKATECRDVRDMRDQAVLEMLIATGARVSEVCSLDIESVDMDAHTVRIHGKGSKERIVYLGSVHTIEALEGYLTIRLSPEERGNAGEGEEHALFLNSSHKRLGEQGVRSIIKRRAKEAGVHSHITPHMFRHTFATALLEQDVDIRYIQQLLGHSSIRTTERYTHTTSTKLRKILEERNPRDSFERELE